MADLSARWKAFAYLILFSIYRIILVIRGGNGFTDDGVGERERERGFGRRRRKKGGIGGGWRRRRFIIKPARSKIRGGWQPLSNGSSVRVSSPQNPPARKVRGEPGCCSRVRSNVNPPPSCPVSRGHFHDPKLILKRSYYIPIFLLNIYIFKRFPVRKFTKKEV